MLMNCPKCGKTCPEGMDECNECRLEKMLTNPKVGDRVHVKISHRSYWEKGGAGVIQDISGRWITVKFYHNPDQLEVEVSNLKEVDLTKPCEIFYNHQWYPVIGDIVFEEWAASPYGCYFIKEDRKVHHWVHSSEIRNIKNLHPHSMETILHYHNEMVFIDEDRAVHFSHINSDNVVLGLTVWTFKELAELTWATGPDVGKKVAVIAS